MVPAKAVIIEKGGAYIYVVRPDNVAERRFIELGPETDNMMIVERGLIPGEQIVVEGYHKLMPGMKVEIVDAYGDAAADEAETVSDSVEVSVADSAAVVTDKFENEADQPL